MYRFCFPLLFLVCMVLLDASSAQAQNSSLYQMKDQLGRNIPLTMRQASIIHTEIPEARAMQKNDIIQIRVDELARMSSEGSLDRRKNAVLNGILQDWVRLNGLSKLERNEQADGDPQVQGSLQETYRAEGTVETTERLTLNMAARITDIRPNGNLVLEGHKTITVNNEQWEVAMSGICRQQDIGRDNTITSDRIIDFKLKKLEAGAARDSYRRGWAQKFYDRWAPF